MFKVMLDPRLGQGIRTMENFLAKGSALAHAKLASKDSEFTSVTVFDPMGKIIWSKP